MEILKFKLFCVEMYKLKYNMSGKEVIDLFNKYDVLNFIEDIYDVLHTLSDDIIVSDINEYINNSKQIFMYIGLREIVIFFYKNIINFQLFV